MVGTPTLPPDEHQPGSGHNPQVSAARPVDRLRASADLVHLALTDRMSALGLSSVTDSAIRLEQACEESATTKSDTGYARAKEEIDKLSYDEIGKLLRLYIASFHTLNAAEQVEIAHRNREKEIVTGGPAEARPNSILHTVNKLIVESALDKEDIVRAFKAISFTDTWTAHPTQAKGADTLNHLDSIKGALRELQRADLTATRREELITRFGESMGMLLTTQPHRNERKEVREEVGEALSLLAKSPYQEIPRLYREVRAALHLEADTELPIVYRFRSWIGGDRDGHPGVTSETTATTLADHRAQIIALYRDDLKALSKEFSISSDVVTVSPELFRSIVEDRRRLGEDAEFASASHTPFRAKVDLISRKLSCAQTIGYGAEEFVSDLKIVAQALKEAGLPRSQDLEDLTVRARTFGLHFAALDIRQHSDHHNRAVAYIISEDQGVDYKQLTEQERRVLLTGLILDPSATVETPYRSQDEDLNRRVFDVFAEIKRAHDRDPASIGSYIVSMTHEVSDLLEVLYLMKRAGLLTVSESGVKSDLDIVPLFETIEDLAGCSDLMKQAFANGAYSQHLAARGKFQEAQFGPSDSNKDGGYLCATWSLWRAQEDFAQACVDSDVSFGIFVGRGGPHARGGGRLHQAILAASPVTALGDMRVTSQGEAIAERQGDPDLFHRHMEQVGSALLEQKARIGDLPELSFKQREVLDKLAEESKKAYRSLVDDPEFWKWFSSYTPFPEMQFLRYASRPIVREGSTMDFENARAIPWNMSWTQLRYNVPGWFGVGSAVATLKPDEMEILKGIVKEHPLSPWSIMLNSVERELARARLPIARWYGPGEELHEKFHAKISVEFDRTCEAVTAFTGREKMVVNSGWLQNHIEHRRNPATDVVNLICARLKQELREDSVDQATRQRIERDLMPLGMNAVAAAMQTTG